LNNPGLNLNFNQLRSLHAVIKSGSFPRAAIEELTLAGGGYGLFTGCAAGDTAAALIVKVG
jgi:hypothetical protein